MKQWKKILAFLLALLVLFSFAACSGGKASDEDNDDGGKKQSGQKNPGNDDDDDDRKGNDDDDDDGKGKEAKIGDNYAEAYAFYSVLIDKIHNAVNNTVDANNARLEEEDPDGYYSDPSYTILIYMPFLSADMAFTSSFSDDVEKSTIEMLYSFMGSDANYIKHASGNYEVTFTLTDWETEEPIAMRDLTRYDNGCIRYAQYKNGEIDEFYEFINLGNDRYALQGKKDRAIVTYKNGEITELIHSRTKYEEDWETGELTEWSVWYDEEADSIWGKNNLDADWVTEKGDGLERIYNLSADKLTISGQVSETDWETDETTFSEMEPIVIPR